MLKRVIALALALLMLILGIFAADASTARQRRTSRRTTNPVTPRDVLPAPTPLPQEPTVVREAGDLPDDETPPRRRTTTGRNARRNAEQEEQQRQEELRSTVTKLSDSVTKLSEDVSSMKGEQRILIDLERLTRAEQRAEGLRAQLRDVTDKEFTLQDRLAQIEAELDPEAIQRRSALIGSLNPSAVREQIRLSLEREKERVQRQLELLAASRVRLESAVASADQEVERIKARIDAADQQPQQQPAPQATDAQAAQPAPTPTTPPAEPPLD